MKVYKLYEIIQTTAIIIFALSGFSLFTFVFHKIILVHPVLAGICLFASPVLFTVGKYYEYIHKKSMKKKDIDMKHNIEDTDGC